jgi:hypothetical protein
VVQSVLTEAHVDPWLFLFLEVVDVDVDGGHAVARRGIAAETTPTALISTVFVHLVVELPRQCAQPPTLHEGPLSRFWLLQQDGGVFHERGAKGAAPVVSLPRIISAGLRLEVPAGAAFLSEAWWV